MNIYKKFTTTDIRQDDIKSIKRIQTMSNHANMPKSLCVQFVNKEIKKSFIKAKRKLNGKITTTTTAITDDKANCKNIYILQNSLRHTVNTFINWLEILNAEKILNLFG